MYCEETLPSSSKDVFVNDKHGYKKVIDKPDLKPNFHTKKATKVATGEIVAGYKTGVTIIRKLT